MIKAVGRTGLGVPLLILGLSGENVTRLTAGEPIRVTPAEMARLGFPQMEVWIHYGRTEDAIRAEFTEHGISLGCDVSGEATQ